MFLALLFIEWGSHGLAFSHAYSVDGQAQSVVSDQQGHEDPCKTMVHGTDGTRQEKPVPNVGHDVTQASTFFYMSDGADYFGAPNDSGVSREKVRDLFRPPSPPFHPPEV